MVKEKKRRFIVMEGFGWLFCYRKMSALISKGYSRLSCLRGASQYYSNSSSPSWCVFHQR
ncbi:MAG: hypothetical protein ABIP30_10030 [Ferruginibacter sp.]